MRYFTLLTALLICSMPVSAGTYYTCTNPETGSKAFSRTPCGEDAEARRETRANTVNLGTDRHSAAKGRKENITQQSPLEQRRDGSLGDQQKRQLVAEFKRQEKKCIEKFEQGLKPGQANAMLIAQCMKWRSDLHKYVISNQELVRLENECIDDLKRRIGRNVQPNAKLLIQCKGGTASFNHQPAKTMPAPSVITNCGPGGCSDNLGNQYSSGGGTTYIRQDGRVCQNIGGMMHCN